MHRYPFLLPFLLLFVLPAPAQQAEFAPAGAEWFYRYRSGWGFLEGFAHAQSMGDTLLDGRICKKICMSTYTQPTPPPFCKTDSWTRYLYQQGDSIFEYSPDPVFQLQLLFRTNFQVGDSMHYYYRAFVVTGIDTLLLNNQPIRRFHLDDGFGIQPMVYDRFGPEDGLFDYSWGVIADGPIFNLRCYQDAHFPQVNLSNEACDFILNTGDPLSGLRLYPNPAHDVIRLEFRGNVVSDLQFQIWDAAGRLVQDQRSLANGNINVQALPAGFYVLRIRAGTAQVWRKFVKN